jgi:hypothetical protein
MPATKEGNDGGFNTPLFRLYLRRMNGNVEREDESLSYKDAVF